MPGSIQWGTSPFSMCTYIKVVFFFKKNLFACIEIKFFSVKDNLRKNVSERNIFFFVILHISKHLYNKAPAFIGERGLQKIFDMQPYQKIY